MEVYTLTIYFIHEKCVDITMSYHLLLKVQCDFIYAIMKLFSWKLFCNYFLITNWNCKLTIFY